MTRALLFLAGVALAGTYLAQPAEGPPETPPVCPGPACPQPQPVTPKPAPRPWGDLLPASVGAKIGGRVAPDGVPLQIDYPGDRHTKNVGGRDGAGLCVFTSIQHAADWGGVAVLADFQKWMRDKPGGGYPQKVDAMIAKKCQEAGVPVPEYLNVEAADVALIEAAVAAGHMVSCTYSRSPSGRYGGQSIAHMVNVVHAADGRFAVLDNNFPGDTRYEWLTRKELDSVRPRWVVILLGQSPSPPPPPRPL